MTRNVLKIAGIKPLELVAVFALSVGLVGGMYVMGQKTNINSSAKMTAAQCGALSKNSCKNAKKECDWKESCKQCVKKDGSCKSTDNNKDVPTCATVGYVNSSTCTTSGSRENGVYCRLAIADRQAVYCCRTGWRLVGNTCVLN